MALKVCFLQDPVVLFVQPDPSECLELTLLQVESLLFLANTQVPSTSLQEHTPGLANLLLLARCVSEFKYFGFRKVIECTSKSNI